MTSSRFCFILALGFGLLSVLVVVIGQNLVNGHPWPSLLWTAFGVLSLAGIAFIWRDFTAKGDKQTLNRLISQYILMKVVSWLGKRQRRKLEADTLNVKQVQEETLLKRLRKCADTSYGKRYDFSTVKDSNTFRARHPITTYEHYRELISRIAMGEDKVIIPERPLFLAMTSGTSGSSSMLLSTKDINTEFFLQGEVVCLDAMRQAFPASDSLQHTVKLFYKPARCQTDAGIPIGPNFSTLAFFRHMLSQYTTPSPAFEVPNERDTLYLHLLFALKDASVGTLESNFASTVFYAFTALQERWQELADDIELGKVSSALALEPRVRARLEALMAPDPERAAELRARFKEGFPGIARRLWPHLNLVLAVDSGANEIYGEMLRQHYCQGVPFYSPLYAATEGLIGVNLWPLESSRKYLLCPRSMFCEFLPESSLDEEMPDTVLMEEVQEGTSYELVITNSSGLFRYRFGDVVKVVGFHNQCPIVEFQYRHGQTLNVRGEKVSETLFLGALKKAVDQWSGARLVDYVCAESSLLGDSIGGWDPHYQVFVELKGVRNLTEEQRFKLDHCLQQASVIYRSFRIKGSIGPMRVQLVAEGAFNELRGQMMAFSNTSPNTFIMPRVLRRKQYADFLLGKTVS